MDSLKNNLIDCQTDLIGKKIVAIDFLDVYPMGYIIVEGGEYMAFVEDCDGLNLIGYKAVEKSLYHSDYLLILFLKHGCISREYYDHILKLREEKEKAKEEFQREREYKQYLELKAKFESSNLTWRDVYDSMKVGAGSHYLKCVEHATESKYEYLAFNDKVYATTDRNMANPICNVEELI